MLPAIEVLKDIQALRRNDRRDVRSDAGSEVTQLPVVTPDDGRGSPG